MDHLSYFTVFFMEVLVFYESLYIIVFQLLIGFFRSISGISYKSIWHLSPIFFYRFHVRLKCSRVIGSLMDGVA